MLKYSQNLEGVRLHASLGEGNTPMVQSQRIGPRLGLKHLYFKLETFNPTGSYKDRFASVAASLMLTHGKKRMLATSSGNTGSALAAYAARFGLELELYALEEVPEDKLRQALAFGARILRVRGFGVSKEVTRDVFSRLEQKAQRTQAVLLISAVCFSPKEMVGVEMIAFEISKQLKEAPDHVFIPVGGGGLFVSCYHGFQKLETTNRIRKIPHLHGVQPEGCATVVGPLSRGENRAQAVECTSSISGLQLAVVVDGQAVLEKILQTGGSGQMVSDDEIYYWQRRMIQEEGIYAEPAGAASLAGLAKAKEEGVIRPNDIVVCLVTGSGFKDTASIFQLVKDSPLPLIDVNEI